MDNESGSGNKPPKLLSFDEFDDWKYRFKNFARTNDHCILRSIEEGPHVPVFKSEAGEDKEKHVSALTADDLEKMVQDNKALGYLSMCLSVTAPDHTLDGSRELERWYRCSIKIFLQRNYSSGS